jgi:hypothetical protein
VRQNLVGREGGEADESLSTTGTCTVPEWYKTVGGRCASRYVWWGHGGFWVGGGEDVLRVFVGLLSAEVLIWTGGGACVCEGVGEGRVCH